MSFSNIVLNHNGTVKLANFFAISKAASDLECSQVHWTKEEDCKNYPPEVLITDEAQSQSIVRSPALDMWALGCMMFHLLTGYHPFEEDCNIAILYRIFKTLGTPTQNILEFPTLLSDPAFVDLMPYLPQWEPIGLHQLISETGSQEEEQAIDLLSGLLQMDPKFRLSSREAMNHPLFQTLNKQAIINEMRNDF